MGEEVGAREAHVGLLPLVPRPVHEGEREAVSLLRFDELLHAMLPTALRRRAAGLGLVLILDPCA
jgi:hypothetical protein